MEKEHWFMLGSFLLGLVIGLSMAKSQQTQNGPVFNKISSTTAYLAQVKAYAEGLATQANTDTRIPPAQRDEGRQLYLAVKTESDGLLAWLQTGLARRFHSDQDATEFEKRMKQLGEKLAKFEEWASRAIPPVIGAGSGKGADGLANAATTLLKDIRETDEKMIDRLRADLEKCHLRDWSELKQW